MALTAQQKQVAASRLAVEIFGKLGVTAHSDGDQLIAVVNSIDTAMSLIINDIPPTWGTKTIKQALIDNLPEPFKSNSTAGQKALAVTVWAMIEGGIG